MRRRHGNSNNNDRPHHLYEIWDSEDEDVFKYGISDYPIGDDGLSQRVRRQVSLYNRVVNWTRFVGRIIMTSIPGRKRAKKIEEQYVDNYTNENGRRPRGNV